MRNLKFALLFTLAPLFSNAQAELTLGRSIWVFLRATTHCSQIYGVCSGEEYELGGYLHDLDNGGVLAFTTSYIRNGAFGSNYALPQYSYNVGRFTSAKVRFGKLWEGDVFDIFLNVGFGYMTSADYSEKTGLVDLLFIDPDDPVNVFTIPIGMDIQWYGFDGSINALGLKYEINGWNNYLGVGYVSIVVSLVRPRMHASFVGSHCEPILYVDGRRLL